jgi:Family of unknown function (DUF6588)
MRPLSRTGGFLILAAILVLFLPIASHAGNGTVQNQISVYTGANAQGYIQPLANAFGAALNSSFGYSAYIPPTSLHISFEAPVMGVYFQDSDKTFHATTESGFQPTTSTDKAPTVVGPGDAYLVTGTGGAQFAFPGGLNLHSFGMVVPQLRVSSLTGTEAVVRWVAYENGDSDLGKISLFGIGGRHSISQYLGETAPVDLAVGFLWQTFKVGKNASDSDFVSTDALVVQLQASKRAPVGFLTLEPYAAASYQKLSVDLAYEDANGVPVAVSVDGQNDLAFTLGAGLNFVAGHIWADYTFANTSNFSFGLALGNTPH